MNKSIGSFATAIGCVLGIWIVFVIAFSLAPGNTVSATPTYPPRNGDPCAINLRVTAPISLTASGIIATGVAGKQIYVCNLEFNTGAAQNIALVEGTTAACASGTAGMAGGSTAATGWNLAINQFVGPIGTGSAWVTATQTLGDSVCLLLSGTGQTSGHILYVTQ